MRQEAALIALTLLAGPAGAQGLRAPERLTAGAADQLLGQLAPRGAHLYFASNENVTTQIFAQEVATGVARPLFRDEAADATWPRVSPDGKHLLYIAHFEDAAGDLCVRELPGGGGRRCLRTPERAELQAVWLPDSREALVLTRPRLHDDFVLLRVSVPGLSPREVLRRNLSSPTVSPDGRWLAYVPVDRPEKAVGPAFFSAVQKELEIIRLAAPAAPPQRLRFPLPGKSGQPAFSPDGRHLYFTQYLNDTNRDGSIDGGDHGVLFRVPFDAAAGRPPPQAVPLQLTSAAWNCQYPMPAPERLVLTCASGGSLDVYALPPDGLLPESAGPATLRDELRSSQDAWERLLIMARLLGVAGAPERPPLLKDMIRLHLSLSEHASAAFYADLLSKLSEQAAMAQAILLLIEHKNGERLLDRGQLSAAFVAASRQLLARLEQTPSGAPPAAWALADLVRSDIYDTLGQKAEALAALRAVCAPGALPRQTDPFVLHLCAQQAQLLLSPLLLSTELFAVLRALAEHPALPTGDRLALSATFIRELLRGKGRADRLAALAAVRADPASDLGFLLELEGHLQKIDADGQDNAERVRAAVFAMYRSHKDPDRRRALIGATVRRAATQDSDYLTYQFANTWVSGLGRELAERRYAERLYRQVVLERAYVQWSTTRFSDARGNFYGVTLQTDSPEAHIGFVEARLREGQSDIEQQIAQRFAGRPDDPMARFLRAYLIARDLGDPPAGPRARAEQARFAETIIGARKHLEAARMHNSVELHHLWGYLMHRLYLVSRDADRAKEATTHYLLALDLAREHPRYRAATLMQLGLLQMATASFRAALSSLEERGKLPFVDSAERVSYLVALARCRFHADQPAAAAQHIEEALRLSQSGDLTRYRPLLLDRAALYHLDAGDAGRARQRAAELQSLGARLPPRNRFTSHLVAAAAAIGSGAGREALADLDAAAGLLSQAAPELVQISETPDQVARRYRILLSGLRAQAHRLLGQAREAQQALLGRREELRARFARSQADEDLLDLALCEAGLAGHAARQGQRAEVQRRIEAGLGHIDQFSQRTGTPIHDEGLALLLSYAELLLSAGPSAQTAELARRLSAAYDELCRLRNPRWAAAKERIKIYLALLRLG